MTDTPSESVVVPREPTLAMISAYCEACDAAGAPAFANARLIWPALLAAAPPAPDAEGLVKELRELATYPLIGRGHRGRAIQAGLRRAADAITALSPKEPGDGR